MTLSRIININTMHLILTIQFKENQIENGEY